MKIPPETILAVKEATNVIEVVESGGVKLRRQAGRSIGYCPFCGSRKSQALAVYRDHYYCHRCQATGSGLDWMMQQQGYGFMEALQVLADIAGIPLRAEKVSTNRRPERQVNVNAARMWWATRREEMQEQLDAAFAVHTSPDDEDCCMWGRLIKWIDGLTLAERLRLYIQEASREDMAEAEQAVTDEKRLSALYEGSTVMDWVRERLSQSNKLLGTTTDPSDFVLAFGPAAYRRALNASPKVPRLHSAGVVGVHKWKSVPRDRDKEREAEEQAKANALDLGRAV